jgi:hypothetical protein
MLKSLAFQRSVKEKERKVKIKKAESAPELGQRLQKAKSGAIKPKRESLASASPVLRMLMALNNILDDEKLAMEGCIR